MARSQGMVALIGAGVFALSCAAETFTIGDWTVSGGNVPLSIAYRGRTLTREIATGCWTPHYASSRMGGTKTSIRRDGDAVLVTRANDQVAFSLSVTCSAKTARVALDADFRKGEGPFEYGFTLPMKTFATPAGVPIMRLDGEAVPVYADEPFPVRNARQVSFDVPEAAYALRTQSGDGAFMMQDRRASDGSGDARFILCKTVAAPKRLSFVHEWSVEDDFDAETRARRERSCARPMDVKTPVAFDNPGFEADGGGWGVPRNARMDDSAAHSGRRSLCMAVTGAAGDGVYVTRQVPVVGGAQYRLGAFVKTEDVKDAVVDGKSSVGAGVIVEWCDKSGRWMQAGEYATGRYGTSDWKRERTGWVTAPIDAGFATVFLTLRGTGRAWFDDVVFERRIVSFDKTSPADGARLATNTPRFTWRMRSGARRYTVQLSRDANFPAWQTKSFEAGGMPFCQLEEPLDEGRWFWRVGANGYSDDLPQSFDVVVPKGRDTLPPQVLTRGVRVTAAGDALTLRVKDAGARRPEVSFMGEKGRCQTTEPDGVHVYLFSAPAAGWPKGLTDAAAVATDESGNCATQNVWFLNAPMPANCTKIDVEGRFTVAGRPFFPLGIYEVAEKEMATVRAAGFDVVHTYRWESSTNDAACAKYLDACWRADGLRAFIGFDRRRLVAGDFAPLARRVGTLAAHPGLFCWYLFDEPEIAGQFVSPDLLTAYADLIRALDPFHVVVMTTWNKTMNEYRRTWDTHWTQAYGDPAGVVHTLDEQRGYLKGGWESPITLLVNSNDGALGKLWRKGVTPDPAKYAKDYNYLRACAMLALPERCNGVWWWWYAPHTREYFTVAQTPRGWADLKRIIAEIRELRPIVVADGRELAGRAGAAKTPVCWWAKTVAGETTFVAVNTANAPVEVEIAVPGFAPMKLAFGARETKVQKLAR